MTHRRVSILLASSALVFASAAPAQQRVKGSGITVAKDEVVFEPNHIAALMASDDSLEIEIGRLVNDKGTDQRVRQFGLMLANDHIAHLAKTLAIVAAGHVGLEPNPDDVSTKRLREQLSWLQENAAGASWDAMVLRSQTQHHQYVMYILTNTSSARDADFEDHLKQTLTSLAKHRDMAKSIATTLGVSLP